MYPKCRKYQHLRVADKNFGKSSNNGHNAGNTDKMGVFGVVLYRLALKWF